MQVGTLEHQLHLFLGEVGIDDGQRQRVESQIPRRVPRVLPFVGHRNDVPIYHVEPIGVTAAAVAGVQGIGVVFVEPVVAVKEEELFAPQHAGQRLPHYIGFIRRQRRRRDRAVEVIGFLLAGGKTLFEGFGKVGGGFAALAGSTLARQTQTYRGRLASFHRQPVMRSDLGAFLCRIDRIFCAVDDAVVDAVLDVEAVVALAWKQPFMIGFVLGKQQRNLAIAGENEFAEQFVGGGNGAGSGCRLDFLERGFFADAVGFGNP